MTEQPTEDKKKAPEPNPSLEQARADILKWASNPKEPLEILDFANLTPVQPYALSVMREVLNFWEQNCEISFKDSKGNYIKRPHDAIIDPTVECDFGNRLIDDICAASVAVGGKRAKLLVESVRDIGRPQTNLLGSLGALMSGKDQEMETPEEVPKYE